MESSIQNMALNEVTEWTPLRFAEETGAWEWVERFLQIGIPLKELEGTKRKIECGDSATDIVRAACAVGLLKLLQFSLSVRPSLVNIKLDTEGTTPLHVAASHRRIAVVRVLVDAGAEIMAKTTRGHTPLHTAAALGAEGVVRILLAHEANVWETDTDGKSAAQLAKDNGYLDVARLLEVRGGKVTKGLWDLIKAARTGDVETVRRLLPLNPQPEPGEWTHLHWATIRGSLTMVRSFVAAGMDPNARDSHGNTPLHIAAARRPAAYSAALVAAGADIDAADSTGSTALHYSVRTGNIPAVRLLLEAGARHDLRDSDGDTPLHRAVSRGSVEAVTALLEAGACRDLRDARGETPYDLARRYGYTDMMRLLRLTPPGTAKELLEYLPVTSNSCLSTPTCCRSCSPRYD